MIAVGSGISQQELASRLGMVPSRLVALLDELEARGFLERRNNADDRRECGRDFAEPLVILWVGPPEASFSSE